jgi:hypothetical protein
MYSFPEARERLPARWAELRRRYWADQAGSLGENVRPTLSFPAAEVNLAKVAMND